jgi:UDP-glucose 4-epimerase
MVVRELLKYGDTPIGYDISEDFRFMGDVGGRFEFARGDVCDLPRILNTMQRHRVEAIIHAAALLPDLATANPYGAIQVNIVGTANMVEAARLFGVRLVFTSTKGVMQDFVGEYGHPTYRPVTEEYPVIPPDNRHTLYNDTKVFCEHYLNRCAKLFRLDHVILRFASMFGPGRLRHGGRAVISEMIEAAARNEPYHLPTGGDQRDDMIYLRDVAYACVRGVHAETPTHRTYLIGSGRLVSYGDIAVAIRRAIPNAPVSVGPGLDPFRIGFSIFGLMDITRARAELGYEPRFSLDDAIGDYLQFLATVPVHR